MSETIDAIYDGEVFRPREPLSLEPNTHCRLTVEVLDPQPPAGDAFATLARLAGTVSAPRDWAEEHDHYLYGTPKSRSPRRRAPGKP